LSHLPIRPLRLRRPHRTPGGAYGPAKSGDASAASDPRATGCPILTGVSAPLIEFPADDPERARRFWSGVLGAVLAPRPSEAGAGWEATGADLRLGLHQRGSGPGDNASLAYFTVPDLPAALQRVQDWAVQ
jgi:hypothetical protein